MLRILVTLGKNQILIEIRFMSWNMRGSNLAEKLHSVRRLIRKHKPLIVGLQETKRSSISTSVARCLWGNGAHNFVEVPAIGASGVIFLVWDVDKVNVHDIVRGTYSVSLLVSLVGTDSKWACTILYGPCDGRKKNSFWQELGDSVALWGVPWIGVGDFNSIRVQDERTSGFLSKRDARCFNNFVESYGLCEFTRVGLRFSFKNGSLPPTLSKLDHFLVTTDWMALFPGMVEKSLNFFDSDHRVIVLQKSSPIDGGPKPFHFQPHWLEEDGLMSSLEGWWASFDDMGNAGFVFHSKLKKLKSCIRVWVKENLCKVDHQIYSLEGLILGFDLEEENRLLNDGELQEWFQAMSDLRKSLKSEEKLWSTKARAQWAKGGD